MMMMMMMMMMARMGTPPCRHASPVYDKAPILDRRHRNPDIHVQVRVPHVMIQDHIVPRIAAFTVLQVTAVREVPELNMRGKRQQVA